MMPCDDERERYRSSAVTRASMGGPRSTMLHGDPSSPQAILEFALKFPEIMPEPREVPPVS